MSKIKDAWNKNNTIIMTGSDLHIDWANQFTTKNGEDEFIMCKKWYSR